MITRNRYDLQGDMSYQGLSTDTKPDDAPVNSLFLELDTGDFYYLETPAQSGIKDILISERSVTGTKDSTWYGYDFLGDVIELTQDVLFVKFDGTEYRCTKVSDDGVNFYGAPYDSTSYYPYDFSNYPFCVGYDPDPQWGGTFVTMSNGNEHTIEVYTESTIPAVWKKVGSGASE